MIQIYNSQTQKKENFTPLSPGQVRMYVCGPTVYDYLHVGNFRGAIFFNLVRNWLEKRGFQVTYVYNYTDVDDKIIQRAKVDGVSSDEISARYIAEFESDYTALRLRPHTHNPRVTEFMAPIVEFIRKLIENGKAYQVDGDVYYDVMAFPEYGKLSHRKLEDLSEGYRIDVDARKKHPADFALWKSAKDGEPAWDSPWSKGRPGWHIECSAMSRALLGDTIDIHGGGIDLLFPHHENEIAQSEGATGKPFVRYWMHNNMLNFGQQKMSKSLGNVRTGRSFLEEFNGEVLKYVMLSAHYRSVIDFSDTTINGAIGSLGRFYSALAHAEKLLGENLPLVPTPDNFQKVIDEASQKIETSMDDDFNTPEVLAALFEVLRAYNNFCRMPGKVTPEKKAVAEVFFHWLRKQGEVLALFQESPSEYLKALDDMLLKKKGLHRKDIDQLVRERSQARMEKNYQRGDELRKQLTDMGINVLDSAQGSEWEVSK